MLCIHQAKPLFDPVDPHLQISDVRLNAIDRPDEAANMIFERQQTDALRRLLALDRGNIALDALQNFQHQIGAFVGHSAASSIGSPAAPRFSAMRRSISGRKCLIRPWIGHAAASPRAQMV